MEPAPAPAPAQEEIVEPVPAEAPPPAPAEPAVRGAALPPLLRGLYRRVGTTIALLGAALIGGLMWYYGGVFTLDYLSDTFAALAALFAGGPWWYAWWIPLVVSAIELFLWPRRERRRLIAAVRLLLWLAVLAFDVLTTVRGLVPVVRALVGPAVTETDLGRGVLLGGCVAVGVLFAFLPETIARWVIGDLWALWVAPLWRRRRRTRQADAQLAG